MDEIESLFSLKKKEKKAIQCEKKLEKKQETRKRLRKDDSAQASLQLWKDDGLGGKFNAEGFTGRTQDGFRVFKKHVMNKPNSGNTRDCPFDCNCCFI